MLLRGYSGVGPTREGVELKHGDAPCVNANVDGQNSNNV